MKIDKDNIDKIFMDLDDNITINAVAYEGSRILISVRAGINASVEIKKALLATNRYEVIKHYEKGVLKISMPFNRVVFTNEGGKRKDLEESVFIDITYPKEILIQYANKTL